MRHCIGCGFCCIRGACGLAEVDPVTKRCTALQWNGERHVCALLDESNPSHEYYHLALFVGEGCCCGLNSWRREPLVNRLIG